MLQTSSPSLLHSLCAAMVVGLILANSAQAAVKDVTPTTKDIGIDQHLGVRVPPDLIFRDSSGKSVRLGDYFDGHRPVILNLVYFTCPMLCPLEMDQTVKSLRSMPELNLGRDYQVVTVSFDPRDTPALAEQKKAHYLQAYGRPADPKAWHFLTGDEAAIKRLTDIVGFRYRYDAEHKQYMHAMGLMVLTSQGKLSRYFYGVEYQPVDLRLSLVQASDNKVGSLSDQFLLLCCQFDLTTGRYTWAVFRLLNVTGAFTILVLGGFIYRLARRRKRIAAQAVGSHATPPRPNNK